MKKPLVSLSVVSHGQAHLVKLLVADLKRLALADVELIITVNLPEDETFYKDTGYPTIIVRNAVPKGFGENHNAAFLHSSGSFFAVVNPDVRLTQLDLSLLLKPMHDREVGAVAPVILNAAGGIEDSVRRFPTVSGLIRRVVFKETKPGYSWGSDVIVVDWAAGMFVIFRREAFACVSGFDDKRFFMYFEDVDICARLWKAGWKVLLQPRVSVIHDAQRASHRSFKHMKWHFSSAVRYLIGI